METPAEHRASQAGLSVVLPRAAYWTALGQGTLMSRAHCTGFANEIMLFSKPTGGFPILKMLICGYVRVPPCFSVFHIYMVCFKAGGGHGMASGLELPSVGDGN